MGDTVHKKVFLPETQNSERGAATAEYAIATMVAESIDTQWGLEIKRLFGSTLLFSSVFGRIQ
jgi:hypothetical protein